MKAASTESVTVVSSDYYQQGSVEAYEIMCPERS
jgi:hypothetical protein